VAAAASLLVAVLAIPGDAPAAQRGQPSPLPKVMQVKLDHAQAVLKALAMEDFTALEREANRLGDLTKQAEWGVLKTPEYARHSQAFLRATESLAASARAGDLNGATLDYATMTVRCVQCHRHVKGVRTAD
jgi:cytochrome c556